MLSLWYVYSMLNGHQMRNYKADQRVQQGFDFERSA